MSNRRSQIENLSTPEHAIREAVIAVEDMGASPSLSSAIAHLEHARLLVADVVDGLIDKTIVKRADGVFVQAISKPAHPCARAVRVDSDTIISLGIAEAELRMSCVHAVINGKMEGKTVEGVVKDAELLFKYVMGSGVGGC